MERSVFLLSQYLDNAKEIKNLFALYQLNCITLYLYSGSISTEGHTHNVDITSIKQISIDRIKNMGMEKAQKCVCFSISQNIEHRLALYYQRRTCFVSNLSSGLKILGTIIAGVTLFFSN